ncbi:MAG TPA: N-acetylglucosamine-6-phosphate deacetylase [Campylobacterales bacterium]|nr:N-acetylglucosamine-6-phosphate deacetylase [Campylobacterales bacterium]
MKAIINAKIITDGKILNGYNLIFNQRIIDITQDLPICEEIIDAKGAYLSAGFIDIHIHGSSGADIMDGTYEALDTISKSLLQTGTTSFLATTMTMSSDDIKKALSNIQKNIDSVDGANILGVHLEGPFINPTKYGAQNPKYIQKPNFELIKDYIDIVKLITLAPEVDGAKELIEFLQKEYPNIILSIGHSDASYSQSLESFSWGVSHATHLFNAMSPLHHREPGIVGAVLGDSSISCEIIADNIHIHPSFYNLIYRLKQEQLLLITDAMRAGCMKSGEYSLGGQKVIVKNAEARLSDRTLAGSVLRLNEALRNVYKYSDIELPELIKMVTEIPAKKLGVQLGKLIAYYPSDIVMFDDDFNIIQVFVDGELKFQL